MFTDYSHFLYSFLIDIFQIASIITYERSKKVKVKEGDYKMGISDKIESFIYELVKSEAPDCWVELKRNELASVFNCVPSQINYVISTRFNPEHGYIVESRRGGGGYLRIKRLVASDEDPILKAVQSIGNSIDYQSAKNHLSTLLNLGAIDKISAELINKAVCDTTLTLPQPQKDTIRANVLKNTLATLVK